MQYRRLGRTGFDVSALGLGCVPIGSSETGYGVRIIRRALELGVNYIDVARNYWDSEIKLGIALTGKREKVFLSTKTSAKTKEAAWRGIRESLERLQTGYLDNCHLHALKNTEDIEKRLCSGGALEALIEAREKGLIRYIGCTSHRSDVLIEAIKRFDFDIILVPMNVVEREPLKELIPLCNSRGIAVTIMKPLATGLLPASLALKWLINQPISTVVPGVTTLEEAEEDFMLNHMQDISLTTEEKRQVDQLAESLDHVRCRICAECEPCPKKIPIANLLGSDVIFDHYRTMGPQTFEQFPWSRERMSNSIAKIEEEVSQIRSCDGCGMCEERCPHGLQIVTMLRNMVEPKEDILRIFNRLLLTV
jgi:predicted aldo/keto reductase-like oxidoreductase